MRLASVRGDAIPDTTDNLQAFPPNAVEKCELQIVCLPMVQAIGNVHHMSWLKPFVTVYPGNRREFLLPPGQNVISYGFIVGPPFWFEGKRMVDTIGCLRIRPWDSGFRIAIDSLRADFSPQRTYCF